MFSCSLKSTFLDSNQSEFACLHLLVFYLICFSSTRIVRFTVVSLLCLLFVGCLQRQGGHESCAPAAAAAAVLRSVGVEGAPWNWRLWKRHKMAKQGTGRYNEV